MINAQVAYAPRTVSKRSPTAICFFFLLRFLTQAPFPVRRKNSTETLYFALPDCGSIPGARFPAIQTEATLRVLRMAFHGSCSKTNKLAHAPFVHDPTPSPRA